MPFSQRVARVSPAPQVASLFNEGVWHKDTRTWSGLEVRRTMERDQAHHTCFLAGGKSLQCAGCSVTPLLVMPGHWVIPCILHCTMAIGRLRQDFIRKESEALSAADKMCLEGDLADHKTRCSIFHSRSPDGEESRALFDAWLVLARRLRIPTMARKYGAVVAMGLLLRDLYRITQEGNLVCHTVAKEYRL